MAPSFSDQPNDKKLEISGEEVPIKINTKESTLNMLHRNI